MQEDRAVGADSQELRSLTPARRCRWSSRARPPGWARSGSTRCGCLSVITAPSGWAAEGYAGWLGTGGTYPRRHDLRLVDGETVLVAGLETRRGADHAVDVADGAARTADDVVVVVADAVLEAGGRAGRLDPAGQTVRGEDAQHVVDGLGRDRVVALADGAHQGVDVGVGVVLELTQDGQAGRRDAQAGGAQALLWVPAVAVGIPTTQPPFLERVKKSGSAANDAVHRAPPPLDDNWALVAGFAPMSPPHQRNCIRVAVGWKPGVGVSGPDGSLSRCSSPRTGPCSPSRRPARRCCSGSSSGSRSSRPESS